MHALAKHCVDQRCCCRLYLDAKAHGLEDVCAMCWRNMAANIGGMLALGSRDFVQLELADVWRLCSRHKGAGSGSGSGSGGGGVGGAAEAATCGTSCGGGVVGSSSSAMAGSSTMAGSSSGSGAAAAAAAAAAAVRGPSGPARGPAGALQAGAAGSHFAAPAQPSAPYATEFVIFQAIMAWVEADHAARMVHLNELLNCVSFDLLGYMELAQVRSHPVASRCAALKDLLLDAYQRHHEAMGYSMGYLSGEGGGPGLGWRAGSR
jgi:hypothetical protein